MACAVVAAGTTVRSQPVSTKQRKMLRLAPKSMATTLYLVSGLNVAGPLAAAWVRERTRPAVAALYELVGFCGDTRLTRSRPSMLGALRARSTKSSFEPVPMAPFCEPFVAQVTRQSARVDAADSNHVVAFEMRVQVFSER